MYTGTVLINPITNKVNGFIHRKLNPQESGTPVPHFLTGDNGGITGINYVYPIIWITGYEHYPELKYKTYDPETNSFV